MRRLCLTGLFLIVGVCALPSSAAAAPLVCPVGGVIQYSVEGTGGTTAEECTSGEGNPNSLADFNTLLADTDLGDGWTTFCKTDVDGTANDPDCQDGGASEGSSAFGLTWDNGTFEFTGDADHEYAIVLKDGQVQGEGDTWAAFLLSNIDVLDEVTYEGNWAISVGGTTNFGRLSHWVIIDRGVDTPVTTDEPTTTETPVTTNEPTTTDGPEPAVLGLLGLGLLGVGRRLRRKA